MAAARTRSKAANKKTGSRSTRKGGTRRTPAKSRTPVKRKAKPSGASRLRQIGFLVCIMSMAFASLALVTYNRKDPGLFRSHGGNVDNAAGPVGAWVADVLLYVLGYGACIVVLLMVVFGLKLAGRQIG